MINSIKRFLAVVTAIAFSTISFSQTVNQVTIYPPNPTSNDTIYVISDFTYYGNCSYGLVYTYSTLVGNTIQILPTYCGYMDTTLCNSVDTFTAGPYPAGNYVIDIEYHQGSICPISGFDAIIGQFDTVINITGVTATPLYSIRSVSLNVFPNPMDDLLNIEVQSLKSGNEFQSVVADMQGKIISLTRIQQHQTTLDLSKIAPGMYVLTLQDENGQEVYKRKFVKE